jgi:hypothetical protein
MNKLLLALIAAGFASATVGALAADDKEPYTAKRKIEKPGRAGDEVKSGAGVDKKYGRAGEETAGTTPKSTASSKKHSKKKKSTAPAPATTPEPKQ